MKKLIDKIVDYAKRFWAFVTETKAELKKVSWPGRDEVVTTTIVVILTSFFFGLFLFVIDQGIMYGIKYFDKLFGK